MVAQNSPPRSYARRVRLEPTNRLPEPRTPLERQLRRWVTLAEDLSHPDVELTVEDFAPILSTFRALERHGVTFDPTLTALIGVLERQAINTADDTDQEEDGRSDATLDAHPFRVVGEVNRG